MRTRKTLGIAVLAAFAFAQANAQEPAKAAPPIPSFNRTVLPIAPEPNQSVVGLRSKDSKGVFPRPVTAPEGAPNVVLVMLDDVGFGASSTFGGIINTPNIQKLAAAACATTAFTPPRCAARRARH